MNENSGYRIYFNSIFKIKNKVGGGETSASAHEGLTAMEIYLS